MLGMIMDSPDELITVVSVERPRAQLPSCLILFNSSLHSILYRVVFKDMLEGVMYLQLQLRQSVKYNCNCILRMFIKIPLKTTP